MQFLVRPDLRLIVHLNVQQAVNKPWFSNEFMVIGVDATSLYAVNSLHSGIIVSVQFFSLCSFCCRFMKKHWCPRSLFKYFLYFTLNSLNDLGFFLFSLLVCMPNSLDLNLRNPDSAICLGPKRIEICITPIRHLSGKELFCTLAWKLYHGPTEQFGTLLRLGTWSSRTLIQKPNHRHAEQFGSLHLW